MSADIEVRTTAARLAAAGWSIRSRFACDYFSGMETAISIEAIRDGRTVRMAAVVDLLSGEWLDVVELDGRRVDLDSLLVLAAA